ncbi:unnamed protein product [Calypogeia fissa]
MTGGAEKMTKSPSVMEGRGEEKDKRMYPLFAADYKLLEEIGQGVSATVYRAICIPFNEVVAIKNLDLEKCSSNLDEIRREAQTVQLILHPNVVRAYCSFVVDHSLWVVMPYLAGGSCLHVMKVAYPDGFDEPVIATVLKETLKALDYLHKHGHIHRDVKAGNILMDGQGGVKLGDFGVSACMFDTGDRQRSRNTFVGTPCWMAPEVMEQVHGYDFKADIWSFGITALELAHGHAPFSKYPPMKVLLMTLQNAPPGLDYERDKRFSKSFKEMIAMCLVKDPVKRPSAEKLLKHSFFKNARSSDYISKHVLDGLPPLGERVKNLKLKDAARLAQKKMPYGEQEEKSQSEYKRGVSCWNFNVEDLKAGAALLHDDDSSHATCRIDEHCQELSKGGADCFRSVVAADNASVHPETDHPEVGEPAHGLQEEAAHREKRRGSVAASSIPQPKGQLDTSGDIAGISNQSKEDNKGQVKKDEREIHQLENGEKRDVKDHKDHDREEHRRLHFGNLERSLTGLRLRDEDKDFDRERDHRHVNRVVDDVFRSNIFYRDRTLAASSGALAERGERGERGLSDPHPINGIPLVPRSSSYKDVTEEKIKGPLVQKKGRFSVTSEDVELPEVLPQSAASSQLIPIALVLPQLKSLLQQNAVQHDMLIHAISSVSGTDVSSLQRISHGFSKNFSRSTSVGSTDSDYGTERERDQYIIELQTRIANLVDELQLVKLKNIQLEHQLSAMHHEEEERIRKEGSAKENG